MKNKIKPKQSISSHIMTILLCIMAAISTVCIISCDKPNDNKAEQTLDEQKSLEQILEEYSKQNPDNEIIDQIKALLYNNSDSNNAGTIENLNARDNNGNSALILAAEHGHIEIVEALIDEGADIELQNNRSETAYTKALQNGNTKILEILELAGAKIEKTLAQIFDEYRDDTALVYIIELVQASGVSAKDYENDTALSLSIDYGYEDVAKALILEGADVSATSRWGYTMLIHAAGSGYVDIVQMILAQANTNNTANTLDINDNENVTQTTALIMAASRGNTEIVQMLILAGADTTLKDSENCTALIHASNEGFAEIVALLTAAENQIENQTES